MNQTDKATSFGCAGIACLLALTAACGSSTSGPPTLGESAAVGRPIIELGRLSPADCRRPSPMPATLEDANALFPCRQLKIVQHHLSSLLREESFRAERRELGTDDPPDLEDADRRRQYFFGPYWSTYQGLPERERQKAFDDDLRRAFPRLMAVLIASTHPTDIDDGGDDWWWELPSIYQREATLEARAQMMRDDVNRWIQQAGIHLYRNVGTTDKIDEGVSEGDMDFPLIELVSFLHQFRDRPDLLDDDSVWTLLHKSWPEQGFNALVEAGWMKTNIPVSGQDFDEALWFGDNFLSDDYSFAETENHVLMTMAHFYLVNQWVTNDYRGNLVGAQAPVPPAGWSAQDWWAVDGAALVQIIRDIAARPVHSGMFEDNARPYQQSSFRALLALASFAEDETIRTEAENALHFLATTFTFQSLDGRRWTPMRRNCEYAGRLEMYVSDGLSAAVGVLSGAYKWNDSPFGLKHAAPSKYGECAADPGCHWRTYSFKVDVDRDDSVSERIPASGEELEDDVVLDLHPQGHALFAAFSGYQLPRALHGFLIDRHDGFFARMMPKYDRLHYSYDTDDLAFPRYFDGDDAFDSPFYNNEKTPAFYFVTNEFANVSGGLYNPLYGYTENSYIIPNNPTGPKCTDDDKWTSDYDNLSRPYVVLPQVPAATDEKGAVLFYQPHGLDTDYNITAAAQTLPMMRGDTEQWFKSANIATYKNFSYGYRVRDTGASLWAKLGGEFPHDIPEEWEDVPTDEFEIGSARFIVYDLRELMKARGQAGYYLITARVRKYLVEFWSTRVARGFWEVVPGSLFGSVEQVGDAVRSLNGPGNFELGYGVFDKDFDYRMVTTRETLRLDQRYGSIFKNLVTTDEGDVQGLIGVQDADGSGVDLEDVFTEVMKESHTNSLPLIDVKAVSADFNFEKTRTGAHIYYACARDGWICVNNREDGSYLWVDSRRGGGFSDNPYWEHGTFDGSPGEWGCSCASGGGGGWTPGPPDNGIPDDCSDPRGCDGHDPRPPREPPDPGREVCENPTHAPCIVDRPLCGPGEICVPGADGTGFCRCDPCVSSGESCGANKPCINPLEQCVGGSAPGAVGMCACVRE